MAAPLGVDRLVSVFAYSDAARELVARVKYRDARHALAFLADVLADRSRPTLTPAPAVVTWPPTTARRRRERGFDHAELLARRVATRLALPAAALLHRVDGAAQTGASRDVRRVGPRFTATHRPTEPGGAVLLVDDVVTTGGTLSAAARALRSAGWARVVAVTAAGTPAPG
jgi:predicted amidophosphoribosyltransferase